MAGYEHDVVAAVLVGGGRALLCHRHPRREWFPDVWDLPGGHVGTDETPIGALVRELKEELGIEISQLPAEPFEELRDSSEMRIRVWVIDAWRGQVANRAPDEHDRLGWFTPSEISSLDLADPRLDDLVGAAIDYASKPATGVGVRRHLTIVLAESDVGDVAALRHQWDPVMAAGVPPHITVMYPEETDDFDVLLDQARRVVPKSGQFELRLGASTTIDGGAGGVFIEVHDDAHAIRSLREQIIPTPATPPTLGPHITITHPRTAPDGRACWEHLKGWRANERLQIAEISYTETWLRSGMQVVETYHL